MYVEGRAGNFSNSLIINEEIRIFLYPTVLDRERAQNTSSGIFPNKTKVKGRGERYSGNLDIERYSEVLDSEERGGRVMG